MLFIEAMSHDTNNNAGSKRQKRRPTFMVPYMLFCVVLIALSWNWIYQWRSQEPDWGPDSDLAGFIWAEVAASDYRAAASLCGLMLIQRPGDALTACELVTLPGGADPLEDVKRWQQVKGPPVWVEDRFR